MVPICTIYSINHLVLIWPSVLSKIYTIGSTYSPCTITTDLQCDLLLQSMYTAGWMPQSLYFHPRNGCSGMEICPWEPIWFSMVHLVFAPHTFFYLFPWALMNTGKGFHWPLSYFQPLQETKQHVQATIRRSFVSFFTHGITSFQWPNHTFLFPCCNHQHWHQRAGGPLRCLANYLVAALSVSSLTMLDQLSQEIDLWEEFWFLETVCMLKGTWVRSKVNKIQLSSPALLYTYTVSGYLKLLTIQPSWTCWKLSEMKSCWWHNIAQLHHMPILHISIIWWIPGCPNHTGKVGHTKGALLLPQYSKSQSKVFSLQ